VSRWGKDIDDLARAVAQLLVVAPAQPTPLADPDTAAAARNAVLAEVRTLIGAVTHSRHRPSAVITAGELATQPVAALVAALHQLQPAPGASDSAGVVVPASSATPVERLWHDAARSCICLQSYTDALDRLPEDTGWAVLRDLVDLASAIPDLDADLAASLPTNHPALPALGEGRSHQVGRLAAREATAHVGTRVEDGKPQTVALVAFRQRPALRPPRDVHDLPAATRLLATVINHRGENITVDEVRRVVRLLHGGLDKRRRHPRAPTASASDLGGCRNGDSRRAARREELRTTLTDRTTVARTGSRLLPAPFARPPRESAVTQSLHPRRRTRR
jgi:hypothetical protein